MTMEDFSKLTSDKITVGEVYPKIEASSWPQSYNNQNNFNQNHLSTPMANDYHLPNSYQINTTTGNGTQSANPSLTVLTEQNSQPKYWS